MCKGLHTNSEWRIVPSLTGADGRVDVQSREWLRGNGRYAPSKAYVIGQHMQVLKI